MTLNKGKIADLSANCQEVIEKMNESSNQPAHPLAQFRHHLGFEPGVFPKPAGGPPTGMGGRQEPRKGLPPGPDRLRHRAFARQA